MSISWGIHVGQQNISMDELRRLWKYADNNGFGWLSVWDHLYCATNDADPHYEAIACLAALACDTKNLRLGCMVFAVPYRNLGLLAKSFMTLNHLSDGPIRAGARRGLARAGVPRLQLPLRADQGAIGHARRGHAGDAQLHRQRGDGPPRPLLRLHERLHEPAPGRQTAALDRRARREADGAHGREVRRRLEHRLRLARGPHPQDGSAGSLVRGRGARPVADRRRGATRLLHGRLGRPEGDGGDHRR